jgi:hypothetical protein
MYETPFVRPERVAVVAELTVSAIPVDHEFGDAAGAYSSLYPVIAYPFVAGATHATVTVPLERRVMVGAAGASGLQARISAVVAAGPLPAEVTAEAEIKRIDPSSVESVNVVDVSLAAVVAT